MYKILTITSLVLLTACSVEMEPINNKSDAAAVEICKQKGGVTINHVIFPRNRYVCIDNRGESHHFSYHAVHYIGKSYRIK